jgi:hypothetical protein
LTFHILDIARVVAVHREPPTHKTRNTLRAQKKSLINSWCGFGKDHERISARAKGVYATFQ